jgi:UDP-glucose 4-epimerase
MNILVTGGAGYIGSNIVKQLLENTNNNVTVIDNLSTGFQKTIDTLSFFGDFVFFNQDLSERDKVEEVFKKNNFDAVIHLAASLLVSESISNPLKYYRNNTANTLNLIELCNQYKVHNFIFSSSAAVYGEPVIKNIPINERQIKKPINPYGHSKAFIEQIIEDNAKANKSFKYVIIRYFNVAGAENTLHIGECHEPETHLIPLIVKTALGKRDKIKIFGDDYDTSDGTCIRDYVHVEDLASSHISSLEYIKNNKSNTFNCGYRHGYSVIEIINTIKEISGVDFNFEIVARRAGDPSELVADNSKILKMTNWKPKYDNLELICKSALEWERKKI